MTKSTTARSLPHLLNNGALSDITPELEKIASQFAVSVTPVMLDLIDQNDPNDPIAKQFIPSPEELNIHPDELSDPISDEDFSPVEGIVHRYPDRALLKLLHACPVYCRFCFRREQVGPDKGLLSSQALSQAPEYIRQHKELWEIILSGGDPLMLSNRRLHEVIQELTAIEHIKVIRIHTRIPVVDPARITTGLIRALRSSKPVYIMIHCNHARELTSSAREACALLVDNGFPLLSQSVLLQGVNDDPQTLGELMRAFVETRIKPHYLHHGDLARGTSHFRLSLSKAQNILHQLRGRLSGLCQPTYILDIPGGHGKVPVGPVYAEERESDWIIKDYKDKDHIYNDLTEPPLHEFQPIHKF